MIYPFFKAHGLGNDYIFFDFRTIAPAQLADIDWSALSRRLSDRHTGIGSDGIVLILPSHVADAAMRIFNADGSEAQMCGNAARCVAHFIGQDMHLETLSGIKAIRILPEGIAVDMSPIKFVGQWQQYHLVSVGNPHAVRFIDHDAESELVHTDGPRVECDPFFVERTNVEFAHVCSSHDITMRVWERGSGETMACGTGATATAHAAVNANLCAWPVTIHLLGGDLIINNQWMIGPAEIIYFGEIDL